MILEIPMNGLVATFQIRQELRLDYFHSQDLETLCRSHPRQFR